MEGPLPLQLGDCSSDWQSALLALQPACPHTGHPHAQVPAMLAGVRVSPESSPPAVESAQRPRWLQQAQAEQRRLEQSLQWQYMLGLPADISTPSNLLDAAARELFDGSSSGRPCLFQQASPDRP